MPKTASFTYLYKSRPGDPTMRKFEEVVEKVKRGKMTYRQAASTLGITYFEFASLLDERAGKRGGFR